MADGCGFYLPPGDELPCDMRIPSDKQDKLHGCLEHLFNQVDSINALLKGPVMSRAFEETKHFPMNHSLQEFKLKEECTIRGRSLIQISIQEDPWNLPNSIKTLVDNIQRYVEGGWAGRMHRGGEGLWPLVWNMRESGIDPAL
ncbi:Phosphatidylinositol-3,4,5-trisphosphate-dependent Rac exchanger 1 protein [Saguinus oedipus]|uniref:Phosphatidylinositol-3,4, 5-trisphosphate-dependent Rac exchanger 1 protein n=1 Tax=Saguinus oedipus TaxID=9490 RepID=A0ABQ9VL37_SAGOE|nr:Phosphatidylinositol-3,4,5-trisphosphate-dependent Rac exchanger 1 protein [Saguinus oedipus]